MNKTYHYIAILFCILIANIPVAAQTDSWGPNGMYQDEDLSDLFSAIFHIEKDSIVPTSKPSLSLLPVIGYNPSFGGIIGINTVMGKQLGNPENTDYSVYNLLFTYSTSGVTTFQSRHNIFTPENKWNYQGNWQFSFYGLEDHGLGTGDTPYCYSGTNADGTPSTENDSIFPIRYNYLRLSEKFYNKIGPNLFVGGGINMNIYHKIRDQYLSDSTSTPHYRYSQKHNFSSEKYSVNGLQVVFQYNTREQPIRSYSGIYFDMNLQYNATWLGSTSNSSTISYDFRKYFALSKKNPTHVLAFWHWATYKISGDRPYLDLTFTGSDTYNRSGRGYTIGYFRGISYAYFETEYRYPILRNNLISGVVFTNFQTAGNDAGQNVFHGWNIGAGAGLRILFQKRSRSALCIDFSKGECGSSGVFFGLNEVF